MEFDHVRGTKRADISTLIRDGAAVHVLEAEIAKCVVRCANCHRRRTALMLWGKSERPSLENSAAASFVTEEGLAARTSD